MTPHRADIIRRYGVAVLAFGLAVLARLLLDPLVGIEVPFITFFLAVVFAAGYGGLGPGLLTTLLSAVAAAWLFMPPDGLAVGGLPDWVSLAVFLAVGVGSAQLGEWLRTAKSRAEASAAEANRQREQLRITLASIGDGVIATDARGRVTNMNHVAEQLTGWTTGEAAGQPLDDVFRIVNEDTRLPVANPAERALREGLIVGLANHTLLIARDGTERPIDDSAAPIRDPAGAIVGCVLVFRDVTRRRRDERALRASAAQFTQLADAIPQLSWMARPDGHIDWYNQRWYEYTGTTFEQMEGWGWQRVHDPDVLPQVVGRWRASLESGQPFEMVFPLRGADGTFRPFLTRVMPFRDDQGRITRWFGTNTDISDQLAAEQSLREADRRKDEFLATLAHELRNPLAPIRTGLEVMKLVQDDPATIEEVRATMERQTQQLIALVDDLLDVSRITRGKLELRTCRVWLGDVVKSAIEAARPVIDEAGHALSVELPPRPIALQADPHRLAQILSNLLNNAAKYTPRGGRIGLSAAAQADTLEIRVRDNGIGIAREKLEGIFEMFAQLDGRQEQGYGGLGIGLTLVKSLVEMHGGRIDVHSDGAGQGSEFLVSLPLLNEATAAAEPTAPPPNATRDKQEGRHMPPGVDNPSGDGKRRVLVVDDNRDALQTLALVVKMLGHEVRSAADGQQALEVGEEFQPDVVLMDLGMPRMNGYEAAQRMRKQGWGQGVMLIALTGWGQEADRQRTRQAGFDHHLTKPAEPDQLAALFAAANGR